MTGISYPGLFLDRPELEDESMSQIEPSPVLVPPRASTRAASRALAISNLTLLSLCRQARENSGPAPRQRLIGMYLGQHLGTWQHVAVNS
jgi:hypothetical protein